MIFNVPGHIEMIRNGIYRLPSDNLNNPLEERIVKTQTRRANRGIYHVGRDYAVQRKRGVKAEPDIRIVIDKIWSEISYENFHKNFYEMPSNTRLMPVTLREANSEGYMSSSSFEEAFRELNPKWDRKGRYVFKFHVIEVQK